MNRKDIHKAARTVAEHIGRETPDGVLTMAQLLTVAGLSGPQGAATSATWQAWQLTLLQFREALVEDVLALTGRMLETVRGEGFRLLDAPDSVEYVEAVAITRAGKVLGKGARRLSLVSASEMTMEQRQRKTEAAVRLGMLKAAVKEQGKVIRPPKFEATELNAGSVFNKGGS